MPACKYDSKPCSSCLHFPFIVKSCPMPQNWTTIYLFLGVGVLSNITCCTWWHIGTYFLDSNSSFLHKVVSLVSRHENSKWFTCEQQVFPGDKMYRLANELDEFKHKDFGCPGLNLNQKLSKICRLIFIINFLIICRLFWQ